MIGKVIYDVLSNDAPVAAIVSTRIYPMQAAQDAPNPCIVFNFDTNYEDTKDNVATIANIDVQIDCYTDGPNEDAKDETETTTGGYLTNDDLATKVIAALDRYTGTNNGFNVDKIRLLSRRDFFDQEAQAYRTMLEFDGRLHI